MAASTALDWLSSVPGIPEDAIFALQRAYVADSHPSKLNLGIGAYRTSEGKPYTLGVVKHAEARILALQQEGKLDHEYLPIAGSDAFIQATLKLAYGDDSSLLREKRVAAVQAVSGTNALRLGFDFLRRHLPGEERPSVYISNPTWGNHRQLAVFSGFSSVKQYRYYDAAGHRIDFDGMLADLSAAPQGSIVVLQPCGHNPTGYDPTLDQWTAIADVVERAGLIPFFDNAYQGYASGDLINDGASLRLFAERGIAFLLAQSFSKNFGLYSERVGLFSIVCPSEEAAKHAFSQLQAIIRTNYSNPPKHGALIVTTILNDPELRAAWLAELKVMSGRILEMRNALFSALTTQGTPGDWSHIVSQIGMFSYTGLTAEQVKALTERFHIYLTADGRINVAGLSHDSVKYFSSSVHEVITGAPPS